MACDHAHRKHYAEIFKLLIKHNANISALDFKGRTPIHYLFVKKNKRFERDQYDPMIHGLSLLLTQETVKRDNFNFK